MRKATFVRTVLLVAGISVLEFACRVGIIPRITMIPPSKMVTSLVDLVLTGAITADTLQTLTSVAIALCSAVVAGFLLGALFHALPRARRTVDPLLATYYSIPVFVFYPLFIVVFGLNEVPKTVIGFMYAVVAMVINTLNGLDRVPPVLWKTARVHHMGRASTLTRMVFPYAAAYLFTGVKLVVAYSFIGVIGSEFILSSGGIGYRISFAYYNFQNDVMYALILLVLTIVVTINMSLYYWERILMTRRGER
jgi:NitT/TauT family transport system permease protein